jgi:hypothetical protein
MTGSDCLREDYLTIFDIFLVLAGLIRINFLVSLCALRVCRLFGYLSTLDRFSNLNEMIQVLKRSFSVLMWIIVVMTMCTLFLSMFLNGITVGLNN